MATTTPNYGWPVPTSTDLVKDGATAIEALGDAIDATVFAQSSGFTLIKSYTFSAVASLSLDTNTFTGTYDNYKIIARGTASTTLDINSRFRVSGSDLTGGNYYYAGAQARTGATQSLYGGGGVTLTIPVKCSSTGGWRMSLDIISPALNGPNTSFIGMSTATDGTGTHINSTFGTYLDTTVIDSQTFYTSTGTITGKLEVYGYKD
jgi:hypothetical protein